MRIQVSPIQKASPCVIRENPYLIPEEESKQAEELDDEQTSPLGRSLKYSPSVMYTTVLSSERLQTSRSTIDKADIKDLSESFERLLLKDAEKTEATTKKKSKKKQTKTKSDEDPNLGRYETATGARRSRRLVKA